MISSKYAEKLVKKKKGALRAVNFQVRIIKNQTISMVFLKESLSPIVVVMVYFFFKENPNLIMCVVELDKFNVQSHRVSFIIFVKVIEKK